MRIPARKQTKSITKEFSLFAILALISFMPFYSSSAADFSGWPSGIKIQFTGYNRPEVITNIPLLVILNEEIPGFQYDKFPSPPSADLRFCASNLSTELNYEIEAWNTTNGNSYIWVQVDELVDTNTFIWALWGSTNLVAPQYTTNGAAWNGDYLGVYHLNSSADDSSSNNYDGVYENGVNSQSGIIAGGIDLAGGAHVDLAGSPRWDPIDSVHNHKFTFSAWVNPDDLTDHAVFGRFGSQFVFWLDADLLANYVFYDVGGPRTPEDSGISAQANQWQYVVATGDGSVLRIYVNGQFSGSTSGYTLAANSDRLSIGTDHGDATSRPMDGSIDEARIAASCFSSNWIWASWANIADYTNFVEYILIVSDIPASNVTATTADLNGYLWTTDAVPFSAWVYYGETDGGTDPAAWDNTNFLGLVSSGLLSTNITGFNPNSEYYYRYFVSNSFREVWASGSTVFMNGSITIAATDIYCSEVTLDTAMFTVYRPPSLTNSNLTVYYSLGGSAVNGMDYSTLSGSTVLPAGQTNVDVMIIPSKDMCLEGNETIDITLASGGYIIGSPSNATINIADANESGLHRIRFTFPGYDSDEVITNIPIAVVLNENIPGFHYNQFPAPPTSNLRFADSNLSTELVYDIEEWNTSGDSIIWVKVPELVKSNTCIWACWGITNTTTPDYTTNGATWDDNYVGVWHFTDVNDSSTNHIAGTDMGSYSSSGVIGKGRTLGGNAFINVSDPVLNIRNQITIEAWLQRVTGSSWAFAYGAGDGSGFSYDFGITSSNRWGLEFVSPSWTRLDGPTVVTKEWHHVTFTFDDLGNEVLYVDGLEEARTSNTGPTRSSSLFYIGCKNDNSLRWNGLIDEMRVSQIARSSNWVWATWASTADHTNFVTTTSFITDNPASNVTSTTAQMNGHLWTTDSVPTFAWVYYGETDARGNKTGWEGTNYLGQVSVGALSTNITGLSTDTTYFYRYYVSNVLWDAWASEPIVFINASITVEVTDSVAVEGTLDSAVFSIRRPPFMTNGNLTVNYNMSGGAVNGIDYEELPGRAVIPDGSTNVDVIINAWEDSVTDPSELANLAIQPGGYLIGSPSNGTVTIEDVNTVLGNWTDKIRVSFPGYDKPDILTNFPVLVVLNDDVPGFRYDKMASADGSDIRFMNSNETALLSFEIESWDTNGNSYLWVKVPELKPVISSIWCWWGNTNATLPLYCIDGTTWSENYLGVWHLNSTNAQGKVLDSAQNNGDGLPNNTDDAGGLIAKGRDFPETADGYIDCGNIDTINGLSQLSIEAWALPTFNGSDHNCCLMRKDYGCILRGRADHRAEFYIDRSGSGAWVSTPGSATIIDDGSWHYIAGVYNYNNDKTLRLYVDGSQESTNVNSGSVNIGTNASSLIMGNSVPFGDQRWDGIIDEVRFSTVSRSANWIWASWASVGDQSNFIKFTPILDVDNPTSITAASATMNGHLWSSDGGPSHVWLYYGESDGTNNKVMWDSEKYMGQFPVGPLSTNIVGLNTDTTYFYRFFASNAVRQVWSENTAVFVNGAISITAIDGTASEEGTDYATFLISRPAALTNGEITVNFNVSGSAGEGTDFSNITHTVFIPIGASSVSLDVFAIDDIFIEDDEFFAINLAAGSYIIGLTNSAMAVIYDNDDPDIFQYRMRISFPEYTKPSKLVDFPVLIVLNENIPDFKYNTFSSGSGYDLRFVDEAQTRFLFYEVQLWNISSNSYIWVQIPAMTNGASIYACWHNPNETAASRYMEAGAAWNSDYRGVWHLDEYMTDESTTGGHLDSTGNGWTGLQRGNDDTTNAILVRAQSFDGIDDRIEMGAVFSGSAYTKELWVRVTKDITQSQNLMSGDGDNHALWVNGTYLRAGHNNTWNYVEEITGTFPTSVWQHVALTYNKDYNEGWLVLYRNGVVVDSRAFTPEPNWGTPKTYFGAHGGGTVIGGEIDEGRLSSVARSDNWIWASYKNQMPGSTFVSYGNAKNRGTVLMLR